MGQNVKSSSESHSFERHSCTPLLTKHARIRIPIKATRTENPLNNNRQMHLGRSLEAVFQVASINSQKREKLVFTRCLAFVTLSLATCFRYRMLSLTSKALGQDICCAKKFCSGRVEGTQNVKAGSGAQRGTRQKHLKGTTLGHASTHWNTASAVLIRAQIKRKRKIITG